MTALSSNFSITLSEILSLKMSLLIISEILGLFVNIMTIDDKYSFHNSEDLWQSIQQQLSKKQKTFSQLFAPFRKSASNFEQFEKKYEPHSLWTSEIMDVFPSP